MPRIVIPLPARDFDPTEVAVSWRVLSNENHDVVFATPQGKPAEADPIMLTGRGLDPWSPVPLLGRVTLLGRVLRSNADARRAYAALQHDWAFQRPRRWAEIAVSGYDGLLLPGGHRARGMIEYLESPVLQQLVADFFAANKPVAAICHGVVLAARSTSPRTGRSVLHGRKTTALTWRLERSAALLGRIGRFWDPNYYRTYPEVRGEPKGARSVQSEVTKALASPADFVDVPATDRYFRMKSSGLHRDTTIDARPAFVVEDGNFVSARWPGDAHTFARIFSGIVVREADKTEDVPAIAYDRSPQP
jgi:putative intracellular protease/amidase